MKCGTLRSWNMVPTGTFFAVDWWSIPGTYVPYGNIILGMLRQGRVNDTTLSDDVRTVWVLICLPTTSYISGQSTAAYHIPGTWYCFCCCCRCCRRLPSYPASSLHPAMSVLIPYFREIQILWSQTSLRQGKTTKYW